MIVLLLELSIEVQAQRVLALQIENVLNVEGRNPGIKVIAITGSKALPQFSHKLFAPLVAKLVQKSQTQSILPCQRRLHDLFFHFHDVQLQGACGIHPQNKVHANQHGLGELCIEFRFFCVNCATQDALDALPPHRRVAVARHVHQTTHKLSVHIAAHKKPCVATLLNPVDRIGGGIKLVGRTLEELVARHQLEHPLQLSTIVLMHIKARALQHLRDFLAQDRNTCRIHAVDLGGVVAKETVLTDHYAIGIVDFDLDVIRIGLPVNTRSGARLTKAQLPPQQFVVTGCRQIHGEILGTARITVSQYTETPLGHDVNSAVGNLEVFVAKEGHVVGAKPLHKGDGFIAKALVEGGAVGDGTFRDVQLTTHRREIADHGVHVTKNFLQASLESVEFRQIAVTGNFEVEQTLGGRPIFGGRRRVQRLK